MLRVCLKMLYDRGNLMSISSCLADPRVSVHVVCVQLCVRAVGAKDIFDIIL